MDTELVVIQPFAAHRKGAVLTDPAEMQAALEASPHCVVRRARQDEPPPLIPADAGTQA